MRPESQPGNTARDERLRNLDPALVDHLLHVRTMLTRIGAEQIQNPARSYSDRYEYIQAILQGVLKERVDANADALMAELTSEEFSNAQSHLNETWGMFSEAIRTAPPYEGPRCPQCGK